MRPWHGTVSKVATDQALSVPPSRAAAAHLDAPENSGVTLPPSQPGTCGAACETRPTQFLPPAVPATPTLAAAGPPATPAPTPPAPPPHPDRHQLAAQLSAAAAAPPRARPPALAPRLSKCTVQDKLEAAHDARVLEAWRARNRQWEAQAGAIAEATGRRPQDLAMTRSGGRLIAARRYHHAQSAAPAACA